MKSPCIGVLSPIPNVPINSPFSLYISKSPFKARKVRIKPSCSVDSFGIQLTHSVFEFEI